MRFTKRESSWALVLTVTLAAAACKGDKGDTGPTGPTGPAGASATTSGQALNINLTAARLTSDGKLQVDYALTDASGNPATMANVTNNWTAAVLTTDPTSNLPAWQNVSGSRTATGTYGTTSQPATDTTGTNEDLGGGKFRYTFSKALASPSTGATYRVAVYSQRPLPGIASPAEAPDYDIANGVLDFVPGGGTPAPRDLVATQNCNACHGILGAHGGFRRDVRLCATCHTTQLYDPDTFDTANPPEATNPTKGTATDPAHMNPLDLGRLVHRIHRGENLPTVVAAAALANQTPTDTASAGWKFHVIGFRNSDNVYGAVQPNPDPLAAAGTPASAGPPPVAAVAPIPFATTGVRYPQDIRNCQACHSQVKDQNGNVIAGAQANDYQTAVSRRTCGSCHDNLWFANASPPDKYHVVHGTVGFLLASTTVGIPPNPNPQTSDATCAQCHPATGLSKGVYGVADVHTSPLLSPAYNGVQVQITAVSGSITTGAGSSTGPYTGSYTVSFKVTNAKDGSAVTDLTPFTAGGSGQLQIYVAGPTTPDYSRVTTQAESPTVAVATPVVSGLTSTDGSYTATFTITYPAGALPGDPTGQTWAVGMQGRRPSAAVTEYLPTGATTPTSATTSGTWNAGGGFPHQTSGAANGKANEYVLKNPVAYFVMGGSGKATPRRQVVSYDHCNSCHVNLAMLNVHGGGRNNPEYCVMCHAPDLSEATDVAIGGTPPAKTGVDPGRTAHFKVFIHSLHTGAGLDVRQPYGIHPANYYGDIQFPGNLPGTGTARCTACHADPASGQPPTYSLDSMYGAGALPSPNFQWVPTVISATPPPVATTPLATVQSGAAACIACHDHADSRAHVQAQTQNFGSTDPANPPTESCGVCHGESADFAVSKVHARFNR